MFLPLRVKNVAQIGAEGGVSNCAFGVNRLWVQRPLDQSDVTRGLWTVFARIAVSHSKLDFQARVPVLPQGQEHQPTAKLFGNHVLSVEIHRDFSRHPVTKPDQRLSKLAAVHDVRVT